MESITQKEVEEYRDLYYGYMKPILKRANSVEEIEREFLPYAVLAGWTLEKFQTFQTIDLMQRLAYIADVAVLQHKKPKIAVMCGDEPVDFKNTYMQFPELRCPIRSEEKRNLN